MDEKFSYVIIKGEYENKEVIGIIEDSDEVVVQKYCAQHNWYVNSKLRIATENNDNTISYKKVPEIIPIIDEKLNFHTEYVVVFNMNLGEHKLREEYHNAEVYAGSRREIKLTDNGWVIHVKITADSEENAKKLATIEVDNYRKERRH